MLRSFKAQAESSPFLKDETLGLDRFGGAGISGGQFLLHIPWPTAIATAAAARNRGPPGGGLRVQPVHLGVGFHGARRRDPTRHLDFGKQVV